MAPSDYKEKVLRVLHGSAQGLRTVIPSFSEDFRAPHRISRRYLRVPPPKGAPSGCSEKYSEAIEIEVTLKDLPDLPRINLRGAVTSYIAA